MKQLLFSIFGLILGMMPALGLGHEQEIRPEIKLEITKATCARVQKHVARNDVTYKAGVDVQGRPVVPADIGNNSIALPDSITIDLSLPLKDLYPLASPPDRALQNAAVEVGKVDYNLASGKLTFNGQELADPALGAIAEECRKTYGKTDR